MRSIPHLVGSLVVFLVACGDGAAVTGGICGNRVIEAGEECDDGNTTAGDNCDASCVLEVSLTCGDSTVDYPAGEQCDDGNTAPGDGCDAACHREGSTTCGNSVLDLAASEQCDDGNTAPGDGCSPACQFETVGAFCGDGASDPGEACDDMNTANGDACNPTCNFTNTTTVFVGMRGVPGRSDGTGTAAQIGGTGTLAADATHLWFADGLNRVVRRIEVATGQVVTIAGDVTGGAAAYLDAPIGLNARFRGIEAITTDGTTVWVADAGRIRAITVAPPHAVTTVAGAGPGLRYLAGTGIAAQFDDLRGLTYYNGLVYLVDANAAVIASFDPVTTIVATVAGTPNTTGTPGPGCNGMPMDGVGAAAVLCSPRYMASDNSGNLFVADTNGSTIRRFNTVTGFTGTFAGNGMCGYADAVGTAAKVHRPRGMTSDGTSLYWVEVNAHTIRQGVLASGTVSTLVGTPPACSLTCTCPQPPPMGGYLEGVGAAAQLALPFSVAYHFPSRSLFFVDSGNAVIRRIQ